MKKWDGVKGLNAAMDRRRFIKSAATVGAVAIGAANGAILPAFAQEADPRKGGHFKLGVNGGNTSDTLDPATYPETFMMAFGHSLHGYLVEVDAEGGLVGELAESWESSKDAKTWTFKLRKGVEFHNGKTLSAKDVIASINHHRSENSPSAAKSIVRQIKEIRSDGPDTVVVILDQGNADFPVLMDHFQLAIMPEKDGKADASGVGAGAYVLEAIDFGVKATSKRFANYWKTNAGWFDSFEILSIRDVTARTNALTTGQIHAMEQVDTKTAHLLKRNKGLEIISVGGTQHYTMPMLVDVPPFDNVDVRLALKYAIDRQQFLDKIVGGFGKLGNDHPIASNNRFFAKDLPQRQFDPEKAKFHLKKAGLSDLKVSLSTSEAAFSGAVDAAVLYQQDAAKAGINVDVVREPADGYWDRVWRKKPWSVCSWGGRPTADWMFGQTYATGSDQNDSHWNNPRFNQLLIAARSELDDAKRLEMYSEMQALCRDDGGTVIPVFADFVSGLSTKVGHKKLASNWDLDGMRCAERWWFREA
ncbi:ABC transporter substrate-binding protein [Mesorhizobium australafricanum]|uniref:ABC transporter substrate-binding protein n=1 Tax=Mesorhizobium australafricanum TaxID=3072311 RepID=A0ABU4X290_9HYPH|nr:ABC transporter substrate-binding protein [Mesorhizobium sp. VK3E]MDX8442424.1 ABC transporter substrate-binding protein [Mesorhizobium sp. VK3E]